jgi:hypothetical protein
MTSNERQQQQQPTVLRLSPETLLAVLVAVMVVAMHSVLMARTMGSTATDGTIVVRG